MNAEHRSKPCAVCWLFIHLYFILFITLLCMCIVRTVLLIRLASIKCDILWSNFNEFVSTMATQMNYIVNFLCHMLVRCISLLLFCCWSCFFLLSFSCNLDFYFWFLSLLSKFFLLCLSDIHIFIYFVCFFFWSSRWC